MITPNEIDTSNKEGIKLNEVEALAAAKIINKLNPENEKNKSYCRLPLCFNKKLARLSQMHIKNLSNLEVSCEHKADINHVSVCRHRFLQSLKEKEKWIKLKRIRR